MYARQFLSNLLKRVFKQNIIWYSKLAFLILEGTMRTSETRANTSAIRTELLSKQLTHRYICILHGHCDRVAGA